MLFIGALGGGAAAFFLATGDDDVAAAETEPSARADEPSAPEPAVSAATAEDGKDGKDGSSEPKSKADPGPLEPIPLRTLERITWTTETAGTLDDLKVTWGIPKDTLTQLNPKLPRSKPIAVGTEIVVHTAKLGTSIAIGPPNDGRLIRGIPLPEDAAWRLPDDRSRAFAAFDTIQSITAAMDAYHQRFPDAEPIQVGELSRRKGGEISGHQSHQVGIDVDVRLVLDGTGEAYDPELNWFFVKTLIDAGNVRAIFLNNSEQGWLREAAKADVGAAGADEYFAFISHEPGHTYHMHVRFKCPDKDKRCVGFSSGESEETVKKLKKLPPRLPGAKTSGLSKIRLPKRRG